MIKTQFEQLDPKNPIPKINLDIEKVILNTGDWNFDIHLKYIPEWLADWIVNKFRSKILHLIVPKATNTLNQKV